MPELVAPLVLPQQTAASVATPAASKETTFADSADGHVKRKDPAAAVTDLEVAPADLLFLLTRYR